MSVSGRRKKAGKRFMHLPRIMECGVDGDDRVVIMEYVAGKTLDELVDDPGYTDESAAVIAVLLCDAVMELHECFDPPMIHRDLKPANVIISSSTLTLIDLGIARTFDKDATTDEKLWHPGVMRLQSSLDTGRLTNAATYTRWEC